MNVAQLLDGSACAEKIKQDLKLKVETLKNKIGRLPGLAVILLGKDVASTIYVNHKRRSCEQVGIQSFNYDLPTNTTQDELFNLIEKLNNDEAVDGILIQLPLPVHIDANQVLERINPNKDVDGFHPYNLGRLAQRRPNLHSCTPFGIMKLLEFSNVDVRGLHAIVVGASNIVGRPMALEFLLAGATVTICHRFTHDLEKHVRAAEVLVVAVGIRDIVKPDWIKEGAIVIDVGMHRDQDGKLCGDLDFDTVKQKASFITPVPGGVGPMTVASLLLNTVQAYESNQALQK